LIRPESRTGSKQHGSRPASPGFEAAAQVRGL
jgi:hypothetical protein